MLTKSKALFFTGGVRAELWACATCNAPHPSRPLADACCTCRRCGDPCEAGEGFHEECSREEQQETLAAMSETARAAGPYADTEGHVYVPNDDAYYVSIAGAIRAWRKAGVPVGNWPRYGYACDRVPFFLDLTGALIDLECDLDTDVRWNLDKEELGRLQAAVDRFNEFNRERVYVLRPDFFRKIAIPRPEEPDDIRERPRAPVATAERTPTPDEEQILLDVRKARHAMHVLEELLNAEAKVNAPLGPPTAEFALGEDGPHEIYLHILDPGDVAPLLRDEESFWAERVYKVGLETYRAYHAWRGWALHCMATGPDGERCHAASDCPDEELYVRGYRPGISDRCAAHKSRPSSRRSGPETGGGE